MLAGNETNENLFGYHCCVNSDMHISGIINWSKVLISKKERCLMLIIGIKVKLDVKSMILEIFIH